MFEACMLSVNMEATWAVSLRFSLIAHDVSLPVNLIVQQRCSACRNPLVSLALENARASASLTIAEVKKKRARVAGVWQSALLICGRPSHSEGDSEACTLFTTIMSSNEFLLCTPDQACRDRAYKELQAAAASQHPADILSLRFQNELYKQNLQQPPTSLVSCEERLHLHQTIAKLRAVRAVLIPTFEMPTLQLLAHTESLYVSLLERTTKSEDTAASSRESEVMAREETPMDKQGTYRHIVIPSARLSKLAEHLKGINGTQDEVLEFKRQWLTAELAKCRDEPEDVPQG
eukprot:Blabericola_migrator_1__5863@NODE_296_length_10232_cov_145_755239_g243_i0_p4_GENE_NODE_296_length_10232_cov_145_755239_g243_i0NODE_296_length_10232_cov_145_755239_g243_i0_p4_ORF_typecomplete_len290_score42_20SUFU_C/PF12470_8/0_028_NODE_296_length_10232_cov_145_755239_g243_i068657734